MKTIILLLFPFLLSGQTLKEKLHQYALSSPAFVISGVAGGLEETLNHHYGKFKKKFPNANDQFWNPQTSWKNKYKMKDGELVKVNGKYVPKFFLSTSALVFTTDAYHLSRTTKRFGTYGGFIINGITVKKQKWWWHVVDAVVYSAVWSASFHLTHDIYFN